MNSSTRSSRIIYERFHSQNEESILQSSAPALWFSADAVDDFDREAFTQWVTGKTLVVRADADQVTGTGHVMRCVALAHAWRVFGGNVVFHTAPLTPRLEQIVLECGCEVSHARHFDGDNHDASELTALARKVNAAWVVQDGYHLHEDYQARVKECDLNLFVIDDFAAEERYNADLVLNQNVYAEPSDYRGSTCEARLLLGLDYVLLRRGFWRRIGSRKTVDRVEKVLVTFGGSDPRSLTGIALKALADSGLQCDVKAIVGPANARFDELRAQARRTGLRVDVLGDVRSMVDVMEWADLAISAGGTTSYELAFMGVPALLAQVADNQRRGAPVLAEKGIVIDLGWYEDMTSGKLTEAICGIVADQERRSKMSRTGQTAVDGRGVFRVIQSMMQLAKD